MRAHDPRRVLVPAIVKLALTGVSFFGKRAARFLKLFQKIGRGGGSIARAAGLETLRDGRWSEAGRSNARPDAPLGAFRSSLVRFREPRQPREHYRTRRTRSEGKDQPRQRDCASGKRRRFETETITLRRFFPPHREAFAVVNGRWSAARLGGG
jgi:hypothetical protein